MRATSDDPKVRENRLRREALRRGFILAKARGEEVWFLHERRARIARICRSLDEVEAALAETTDDQYQAKAA